MSRSYSILLACFLLALPAIGCGTRSGPTRASVEGVVSVDGEPIETGSITFTPTEGTSGPIAGGPIERGRYRIAKGSGPVVGRQLVSIRGLKKSGRKVPVTADAEFPSGGLVEELIPAVPPQYNDRTTLVREIVRGHQAVDFALRSE